MSVLHQFTQLAKVGIHSVVISFLSLTAAGQVSDSGKPEFSYDVVKAERRGTVNHPILNMYVVLEEPSFNKPNLLLLFSDLSKADKSTPLSIKVFSEKKALLAELEWERLGVPYFPATEEGDKARKAYFAKFAPTDTGHFRAYYIRNAHTEYFYYSPSKSEERMVTVVLRDNETP